MTPYKRAFLNLAITLFGVLAVAVVGLVVEDLLPNPDHDTFNFNRVVSAFCALALLLFLVFRRTRTQEAFGTLYYVTYLAAGMRETHISEVRKYVPRHGNAKRLSRRWLASTPSSKPQLADIAMEVMTLGQSLQVAMNEDDISSGFSIAPDLLFPMSLSLGYDLIPWDGTTLDEMHLVGLQEPHVDRWVLDKAPTAQSSSIEIRAVGERGGATRVVADLTERDVADAPWCFATQREVRVAAFAPGTSGTQGARMPVLLAECHEQQRSGFAVIPAAEMVDVLVNAIRGAVHESGGEPVLLALRAPKTVILALGWALRSSSCPVEPRCPRPACANPWDVLVPLHFAQGALGNPYIPMRVHVDQPPLETMQARIDCLVRP